jgi:predicted phosphoribosyltransferase
MAIGYWYEDFPQTGDEEVVKLLERAKHDHGQIKKTRTGR